LGLHFIIVFGLKFGFFTPTEAAVVAAVYSCSSRPASIAS
jgi:TRAP-type C4-dicarboxylate transport system permease large subunit